MKIAFWSNANQKCGVTANLAAISVASVNRFPNKKIVALENRLCQNNLGQAYLGRSIVPMQQEAGHNYYDGGGIEGLLRRIYRQDYCSNIIASYQKVILPDRLFYIPQTRVIHSEIFEYEFDHDIDILLQMIDEYYDICFIDTASRNNLSSKKILEEADLIVVNLCQNKIFLEDFFLNYSSLISKAVFLIGNYSRQSKISCKRIAMKYDIPMENITVIPSNELYRNAFMQGNVVEFIKRNLSCDKEHPNYLFIQSVKKAAYMIIKKAEQMDNLRKKELSSCGR